MTTFKFKTDINCGNCIRSVTPFLNELDSVEHWQVDTEDPKKILTVESEDEDPKEILEAIRRSGFSAETIDSEK